MFYLFAGKKRSVRKRFDRDDYKMPSQLDSYANGDSYLATDSSLVYDNTWQPDDSSPWQQDESLSPWQQDSPNYIQSNGFKMENREPYTQINKNLKKMDGSLLQNGDNYFNSWRQIMSSLNKLETNDAKPDQIAYSVIDK